MHFATGIAFEELESSPAPQSPGSETAIKYNVMVIDDNEEFHPLIREILEPVGYALECLTNPVKALEKFSRDTRKYDLVLLDFYMPGLDGAKTFEWLRKLCPTIKVIIVSGADELRLRQIQARHGIDAYIHKPFRPIEVVRMIDQVMEGVPRR